VISWYPRGVGGDEDGESERAGAGVGDQAGRHKKGGCLMGAVLVWHQLTQRDLARVVVEAVDCIQIVADQPFLAVQDRVAIRATGLRESRIESRFNGHVEASSVGGCGHELISNAVPMAHRSP